MVRLDRLTWTVAALACDAWIPFVGRAATSDEGGYLEVAAQWASGGGSLYGDYWVDRPPLLIALHALAAALGGVVALRLIGIAAVVASVLLSARLLRVATGIGAAGRVGVVQAAPVVVAGAFLSTPLFGTTQVDGELLSVPFVLAGMLALMHGLRVPDVATAWRWMAVAGVAAVAAAMVKQNAIDVFVAAAVLLVVGRRGRPVGSTSRLLAGFAVGALATTLVLLGSAALLGTPPAGLWDAVVTFRFEAATVIGRAATSATPQRLLGLIGAAAASTAPLLVAVLLLRLRRSAPRASGEGGQVVDLRWAGIALLAWEIVVVVGGGSYWLHYLLVLVPGLVVLAVAAAQRPPAWRRLTTAALGLAWASAAVAVVVAVTTPRDGTDVAVASYLRQHARPGDGAVVAFGHPDILWDSGLQSPYAQLWSLPVKVRDPRLTAFDAVLKSPFAPEWVVVDGTSLATWGVDATEADKTLATRYHVVAEVGSYQVWRHDGLGRR